MEEEECPPLRYSDEDRVNNKMEIRRRSEDSCGEKEKKTSSRKLCTYVVTKYIVSKIQWKSYSSIGSLNLSNGLAFGGTKIFHNDCISFSQFIHSMYECIELISKTSSSRFARILSRNILFRKDRSIDRSISKCLTKKSIWKPKEDARLLFIQRFNSSIV